MTGFKLNTLGESGNRVGIDVGTFSVKMLQISGPPDRPSIAAIGYRDISGLPAGELSDSIRSLADEAGVSSKDAHISISGPSVIVRFISLPRMDDNALKGAIRYEAEKFIPYNVSDCTIDFQTLRKDDKDNKINILLVAAKKDYVLEKIKIVEKAGFAVKVVDVDSFAIANAFLRNHPAGISDKSFAVLNIGAAYTNLSILKGESIFFSRDIALGGNDFTFSIAKKFGIDQKEAQGLKVRTPKDKEAAVSDCIKSVFNDLMDEVKLSFGYYENQAGKGIDEIYISGGGSDIIGLEQMFEEGLGSKPLSWNPIKFLEPSSAGGKPGMPDKAPISFCVAAGLLVR